HSQRPLRPFVVVVEGPFWPGRWFARRNRCGPCGRRRRCWRRRWRWRCRHLAARPPSLGLLALTGLLRAGFVRSPAGRRPSLLTSVRGRGVASGSRALSFTCCRSLSMRTRRHGGHTRHIQLEFGRPVVGFGGGLDGSLLLGHFEVAGEQQIVGTFR